MYNVAQRTCSKCKVAKPLTFEFFSSHPTNKYGLRPDCRQCVSVRNKVIYARNREAILSYQANYRQEFPQLVASSKSSSYQKKKPLYQAKNRKYAFKNPEAVQKSSRNRRARKAQVFHRPYTTLEILNLHGTICWLCGLEVDLLAPRRVGILGWEKGLHLDHIIPLTANGPDVLWNVQPAHAICNMKRPKKGLIYLTCQTIW
jgi:5-methylcytosine-specific restriction endonuclease McrA